MDTPNQPESDLTAEFKKLGQNLKEVLHTAWNSEERKKIQSEIEAGLSELEAVLKDTSEEFTRGATGQRLKAEVEDLRARLHRGEVQARMRADLLEALATINAELQGMASKWTTSGSGQDPSAESGTTDPPAGG